MAERRKPTRRASKPAVRKPAAASVQRRPARIAAPTPLLAVDIGNSETVVGRFLGAELDGFWRLTSGRSTQDELRLALEMLVHTSAVGWGSILCSVVPSLSVTSSASTRLKSRDSR